MLFDYTMNKIDGYRGNSFVRKLYCKKGTVLVPWIVCMHWTVVNDDDDDDDDGEDDERCATDYWDWLCAQKEDRMSVR